MPRIWWLIIGHGPSQVVKMKSATQTWPSSEFGCRRAGRSARSVGTAGTWPSTGSGCVSGAHAASSDRQKRRPAARRRLTRRRARRFLRRHHAASQQQHEPERGRHRQAHRRAGVRVRQPQRVIQQRDRIGQRVDPHDAPSPPVRRRHGEQRARHHPHGHQQQVHDGVKPGGGIHSPGDDEAHAGERERNQEDRRRPPGQSPASPMRTPASGAKARKIRP